MEDISYKDEKIVGYNNNKEGVKCMVCNHYYFKDKFNYQPYVCNYCHNFSMTVTDISDFHIVNIKGNDYRVYVSGIYKKEAVIIFKNSNLDDKGVLKMDFAPNITPIDVIKKGAFDGTYFRGIYSNVNNKRYKNSWKEFEELKDIDKKYYSSDFYDIKLNYYSVEVGTSLRFWESEGWINEMDSYRWFEWYFRYWKGRRSEDDKRQINRRKKIVSRFAGILSKSIRDGKDSKKIRQTLLHWCYELTLS